MPTEPTILVKKSDGTFVRKPLSEVKAGAKITIPVPEVTPRVELASRPKPAPKVLPKSVAPKPVAKPINDNDFINPLEEPPEEKFTAGLSLSSNSRLNEAQLIIKGLTFTIAPNLVKRLENAIILYLKDVRTREQTKIFFTKSINSGGLAFAAAQAEEVLKAGDKKIEQNLALNAGAAKSAFLKAEPIVNTGRQPLASLNPNQSFSLSGNQAGSRLIADVVAPALTVNPINELRQITALDFRRLSKQPEQAAQILFNKFAYLKQESIIFYLQSLEAWQQSPLYKTYVKILGQALSQSGGLSQAAGELTLGEVNALTSLNSKLE